MTFFRRNQSVLYDTSPGRQWFTRLHYGMIIFIAFAVFIVSLLYVPFAQRLVIVEEKTGRILYAENVRYGDTFTITYIHSVNKSPVDDIFEIQPDYSIMLRKTVFRSFGAGVPFELEEQQVLNTYEDRIEIDNINRHIAQYLLFVGTTADHVFSMHGRSIHLNQLTRPQNTVRFEVRRVSVGTLLQLDKNK